MNSRLIKIAAAVTVVAALALGGAAWAIAGGGDDDGPGYTGPGAERAKAAAVAEVGGTANAVEKDDEEGAWEVEVTKADGGTVDVHLDENFNVIGSEGDSETEDESGGDDD
jgi:Peptidase propeptide and YPEB domain